MGNIYRMAGTSLPLKFNRKVQSLLCVALLITQSTCISSVDVKPSDFKDLLVVQGFINDDFGPHSLRITRVAQFSGTEDGGSVSIIEDALVTITDQDGQSTLLTRKILQRNELILPDPPYTSVPCVPRLTFAEIKTDYRTPETFKGEIGNTYTLEITTKEGQTFRSEPQTIQPTPPIDSLSLAFKTLPGLDPIVPESAVEIFSSWQDPSEADNYYFWRINGIYKISTPDRSTGDFCCAYDPRDGEADDCWIIEKNLIGNELAFSDERVNGQIATTSIGMIEDNGLRFAETGFVSADKQYYIEVEQYMIPEKAFRFNEKLKTLSEINGEIFDPPPLSIRGNVFDVNNSEETVIGYFGAYSAQKKSTFLNRSLLEFTQIFPQPCGDCRLRSGAQIATPEPYK